MDQNLPTPRPCPPWCRATHEGNGPERTHMATVGPFSGPGQLTLRYAQFDKDGKRDAAFAQLGYLVDGEPRVMDIEPVDAHDWSNVIGGLDIRSFTEFAAALSKAFRVLDGGE